MSKGQMPQSCKSRRNIDSGWAWVVLIASYIGVTIACVTLFMNGVFYIALLDRYGEGETKTSLVGAISIGLYCLSAPIAGVLNNKFSCRVSIVVGGTLTTLGFVLSAFMPSLNWMIVTLGFVVGLGYGISSSGLVCVVGFYFEKWRDGVLSFALLIVGIAMFPSAPLGLYLINNHGLTATFLIIACFQAQMCVIGVICRPSAIEQHIHELKKVERACKDTSSSKTYIDLTLLKNIPYMGFLCNTAAWNFAFNIAIMHLPNYVSVLGGTDTDIGYILSTFSVANVVGRLSGSLTISKLHYKSFYIQVLVLAITGLMSSMFPLYSKVAGGVYIFTIQLGIFVGIPNAMLTPLSLGFVGLEKLSEAYSLAYVFCGLGVTTGPVLIGYIYSLTNSYEYSFVFAGGVLLLGCVCGVVTICTMRKSTNEANLETIVITDKENCDINKILEHSNGHNAQKPLLSGHSKSTDSEVKHRERSTNVTEHEAPDVETSLINSNHQTS